MKESNKSGISLSIAIETTEVPKSPIDKSFPLTASLSSPIQNLVPADTIVLQVVKSGIVVAHNEKIRVAGSANIIKPVKMVCGTVDAINTCAGVTFAVRDLAELNNDCLRDEAKVR